jgi:RHS repeat-associated protein
LVLPSGWGWAALKAWLFGPTVRHLHTARAGRVLSMSEGGDTIWRDAEGMAEPAPEEAPVHQPLRYVGQYHDAESGLDYHGARFFEPGARRFISPDPAGVADAIDGLAPSYLLDLYAYAGGQPEEFFDPDGAARIRYFAITTNAQGKSMGSTLDGFVKARWAFIVDNVAGGGDASAVGQLRERYASAGMSDVGRLGRPRGHDGAGFPQVLRRQAHQHSAVHDRGHER